MTLDQNLFILKFRGGVEGLKYQKSIDRENSIMYNIAKIQIFIFMGEEGDGLFFFKPEKS